MDDLAKVFIGAGVLCFGIVAAAVGIRVYQSETLVAVIVGGGMVVLILAAVAVVGMVGIRLLHVNREEREQRLIVARSIQAIITSSPDGGGRTGLDPAMMAAIAAALGDGQAPAGQLPGGGWTEVERPKLAAGGDS